MENSSIKVESFGFSAWVINAQSQKEATVALNQHLTSIGLKINEFYEENCGVYYFILTR